METIGTKIGRKDKNGIDICVGDRVLSIYAQYGIENEGIVTYSEKDAAFMLMVDKSSGVDITEKGLRLSLAYSPYRTDEVVK